jgi:hypothetical protein
MRRRKHTHSHDHHLPPITRKFAFVLGGRVVDTAIVSEDFGAILSAAPTIVEITDSPETVAIGWSYQEDGTFTPDEAS